MTKNKKRGRSEGAGKVQAESPKGPGGAFPVAIPHLLYRDWQALKVDGRSWYAKRKKELIGKLLEHFRPPIPGPAEVLANITATNLLLMLRLEGLMHTGQVAPSTFQDYIRLTNSNSANLMRLWSMARESGPAERVPSLQEYLASLKEAGRSAAVQVVKPEGGCGHGCRCKGEGE